MDRRDANSATPPGHGTSLVRVVAAVISRGNELLVCQRPLDKRHGGLWEFPGGKCEPGESDLEAARRELREELDVDVLDVGHELFTIVDGGTPFHIAFVPVRIDGEPTLNEHTAVAWRTLAEMAELPLAPSDRQFVEFSLRSAST